MTSARPLGGGGVGRRDRVQGGVEADTPELALYRRLEFFPTAPWAARAGAELVQRYDPGPWIAEEPACGQGHMAEAVRPYFAELLASDVHPHGYGEVRDFLTEPHGRPVDWIFTNPPFRDGLAEEFVRLALDRARRGVAILQQTTFLDTVGRHDLIYGARPLTVFAQFAERPNLTLGSWDPAGSTATAYAWFLWIKPEVLEGLPIPRIMDGGRPCFIGTSIPPGTRALLTHPDDAARWGVRQPKPPRTRKPRGGQ
jgi:hypothetical protein